MPHPESFAGGEVGEYLSEEMRSAIVVRDEEMLETARNVLREYDELNGAYRALHPNVQVGLYGVHRYPEIFKGAILKIIIESADRDRAAGEPIQPILLATVTHLVSYTTPHILVSAEEVPYVRHPLYGQGDKVRLPYRPDFDEINRRDDDRARAFAESYYVLQKFMAGLRGDIMGGSDLLLEPNTWEYVKQMYFPSQDQ